MSRQKQQQQQQHLLTQATSHGPYLWTNRDVENALLWFLPSSSPSDASDIELEVQGGGGREFLRRLIHARGISVPRPLLHSRSKKNSNKKKRKSSDDGKSNDQLQSVLMGYYYQIFANNDSNSYESSSLSSSHNINSADGSDAEKQHNSSTSDIQKNTSKASDALLHDLNTIISARQHNNDIYNAYRNMCWQGNYGKWKSSSDDGTKIKVNAAMILSASGDNKVKVQGTIRMGRIIEEYMIHPSTCAKRVYASKVFDRLVNLCNNTNTPMGEQQSRGNNKMSTSLTGDTKNDALHKYLEKLFGLAYNNIKIQEVIMLLVLEPFRRLQQQCAQEEKLQEDYNDSKRQQQPVPGMDFSPLLTSASFWADTETIEKIYAQPLVPSLIHFILQSSPPRSPKLAIGDDNNNLGSLYSTAAAASSSVAQGDKYSPSSTISWWTLPSPLLCTVSQLHYEIACKYIRYWIEMAVLGHDELYNTSPTNLPQSNKTPCDRSAKIEEESSFHNAIQRIKQFFSTSDRLNALGRHTLCIMEKESKDEIEMSLLSEEAENAAYRRSLAWKAIHNGVY